MTESQFKNDPTVSINGTCLQGYIKTTYDELVNVFGEPTNWGDGGRKVNVQWIIKFSDGTVATIYDWKMPRTPMGVYDWHIGGMSQDAVNCVKNCMSVTI